MADHTVKKEYLEEIKQQFKMVSDSIESIKRRSMQIISFIGAIIAAGTGLGLSTVWEGTFGTLEWAVGTFTIMVGATILGISLFLYYGIIKTRLTLVPIVSKRLLQECYDGTELSDIYNEWIEADQSDYYQNMSRMYLDCISDSEKINDGIADRFNLATKLFVAGTFVYAGWVVIGGAWS